MRTIPVSRSALSALCAAALVAAAGWQPARAANDYPTEAVADYVFACVKANGESPAILKNCSCSIDVIASLLPYERYESASTFLSMGQVAGEKGVIFRTSAPAKAAISDLRRAQAEAEVRCFY